VLELGCGWGAISLTNAARFPHLTFISFSNSPPQIEFIRARAKEQVRDERLVGIMRETSFHLGPVDDFERRLVEVGHHTARPVIKSAVPDAAARPLLEF
jgi:tRNA G46 methylase TrmB